MVKSSDSFGMQACTNLKVWHGLQPGYVVGLFTVHAIYFILITESFTRANTASPVVGLMRAVPVKRLKAGSTA